MPTSSSNNKLFVRCRTQRDGDVAINMIHNPKFLKEEL